MEKRKLNKNILHWLGLADEDYLAARLLILKGFLKQGVILSNTAIEKYLKTFLFYHGETNPWGHDTLAIYNSIHNYADKISSINKGFITFLSKAYLLRYTDELPNQYNIHLDQIKILVELDRTVYAIRKNFKFENGEGKPVSTRLDFLIENKDYVLLEKNSCFGNYDQVALFKEKSQWLSLLVYGDHNIIEGLGEIEGTMDDGKFDIVGIREGASLPTA
jgi:HEPN domain-containing protein